MFQISRDQQYTKLHIFLYLERLHKSDAMMALHHYIRLHEQDHIVGLDTLNV